MATISVTLTRQGGDTLIVNAENGVTVGDVLKQIGDSAIGKQFAVNGRKADVKTPLAEGDVVGEAKSAKGGY